MKYLQIVIIVFFLSGCSSTKALYVSCSDRNCAYCIGSGIRGECRSCQSRGHNFDLFRVDPQQHPVCQICSGYGVIRCGYVIEVDKKSR